MLKAADEQFLEFPLTISQLANAGETTVFTVRNYLIEGLLSCCTQTPAGHGRYDQCALNRLRFIRVARKAGLLILDIKPLLKTLNGGDKKSRDEALKILQSKIADKQVHLDLLESQLIQLEKLG